MSHINIRLFDIITQSIVIVKTEKRSPSETSQVNLVAKLKSTKNIFLSGFHSHKLSAQLSRGKRKGQKDL